MAIFTLKIIYILTTQTSVSFQKLMMANSRRWAISVCFLFKKIDTPAGAFAMTTSNFAMYSKKQIKNEFILVSLDSKGPSI